MKKIILLVVLLCISFVGYSQTTLTAGDIAFVGSNTDGFTYNDDNVAFVLLKDIDAATTIIFTDKGWDDTTGFSNLSGDSQFTWVSESARTAGSIVTIYMSDLGLGGGAYSVIGDQLFAIQGSIATPIFIAGLQYNGTSGDDANWDGIADLNSKSALPDDLITGDTAVRLVPEHDNWQFSCVLAGVEAITGTPDQIRAIVHNPANWISTNVAPIYIPAAQAGCTYNVILTTFAAPADLCIDAGMQAGLGGGSPTGGVYSGPGVTDDGNGVTYSFDPTAAGVGIHTITYTENGNSASDDIEVFALPAVTFTAPTSPYCPFTTTTGLGGGLPTGGIYSGAGVTDDGNGNSYSFDSTGLSGDITITYTFTDANGCTNSNSDDVTVQDTTPPTISCPADIILNNENGVCGAVATWLSTDVSASDNCSISSVTQTSGLNSGDIFPVGTTTNTFLVSDNSGLTATCSFNVIVEDNEDPTWVNAPTDLTVECDGAGNVTEFDNWLNNTFTGMDNCPNWVITNDSSGLSDDCGMTGSEIVTFRLTDESSNFIELDATFTIEDATPPTIDVEASDLTVECDGNGNTTEINDWLASIGTTGAASDTCAGVTWTNNFIALSDDCGMTGSATVTFTATDECNLTNTTTATFTIEDTTPPTIDVEASDLTVECDGNGNTTELNDWLASIGTTGAASDSCAGVTWTNDFTILNNDVCGALTTVIFTATDECGNFVTTEATINTEDTIPPVIGCPGDVTAVTEDGDCGAIVNFQPAVAIDNCGSAFTYQTGGLGSGSVFPVGDTLIEYTAQDDCGNLATCTFMVTVIDDDAPVAICQDLTVTLDDTGNATITADQLNFGSNDNCGVGSVAINVDTFDCSNVGANEVTLTVTDIHGNTATCVATVTVLDNTAPITVCQNITLELGDDGTVTIDPLAVDGGSSDACGIASYELNTDTLDCSNLGNTTVILTVTDVNGNQSSCSAIVTLEDNSAPILVCSDVTIELNQDGVAFIIPSLVADITDNCGTGAVIIDVEEVSCADIGTPLTVNVFANDGNGNSAVCSAVLTVVDLLGPEIVCPDNQAVNLDPDGTYTLGDYIGDGSATATDNCTDPVTIFSQDPAAGSVLGFGTQVITFTAEDQYGNVSTCSFELDIQEILGAGDAEDFASLVLYPNPADNEVILSNPRQIDLSEVTIYDLTGRIVHKVDLSTMGSEITIDISMLANANYILVIKGLEGIFTKQLIVNNY
ncbi:MAG: HYR domain-containing protein [Flavobacteriaceae bacterium]|nr:HYR domain-containing protein [Flavobacteriaceae bacterium]